MFENAAPLGEPSIIALVFHVQSYLNPSFVHPPRAIQVPAVACTQVHEQEFRGECGI
jgi:hypothetical protein